MVDENKFTYMDSEELETKIAVDNKTGDVWVDDKFKSYYKKHEVETLKKNGGITKNINIVRGIFKGVIW